MNKKQTGFTLVELMIVIAIVAILSLVMIPSYSDYVRKAKRAEAKVTLVSLGQLQESFFSSNNRYTTLLSGENSLRCEKKGICYILSGDVYSFNEGERDNPNYKLTLEIGATNNIVSSYKLTATAYSDSQKKDVGCQVLTLDSRGQKVSTPKDDCW